MEKHYRKMVLDTQERTARAMRAQIREVNSPYYGGFYDKDRMVHVKYAIYRVATMTAAYCNEDTCYYHEEKVERSILLGLSYIERQQHENGLFDYVTCNFSSAPDTAFDIKKLIPVYEYLQKRSASEDKLTAAEEEMKQRMGQIIKKGAFGLLEGGFHTPNHRWAIASLLAKTGTLFGEDCLIKAADAYLIEGIDCNEDGEFSEKSAGNYNRVNNDAMIMLSESLGDAQYEAYAIRNLKMMLTYFEPDWSVFTANSTRFDKDLLLYPKDYYLEYLRMGVKYQIPEFLDMCNRIFQIVEEKQISSPDFLIWLMLYPEYRSLEWEGCFLPADFTRYYEESGILRARKDSYSYTVMKHKSSFLFFHNGSIKLEMKVAGSFCEHRAFYPEQMEVCEDGSIALYQKMRGWYYLPFREKQETSDWWKMDQSKREKKLGPDLEIFVRITPVAAGLNVRVRVVGVEGAPWRVELAIQGIHSISSEHLMLPVSGGEVLVMKEREIEVSNDSDALIVGPGFGEHRFVNGKEDSEGRTPGAVTLYFTDYTGFDHEIWIRNRREMEE